MIRIARILEAVDWKILAGELNIDAGKQDSMKVIASLSQTQLYAAGGS